MSTITLTFAESGENGVGQEIIGTKCASGYSLEDLQAVQALYPDRSVIYDLRNLRPDLVLEPAYLLVVKSAFEEADECYRRLVNDEAHYGVEWDKKKFMRGQVKNSQARYNLLFDDLGNLNTGVPSYIRSMTNIVYDSHGNIIKRLPNYEQKEGTIYNYNYFPEMRSIVSKISSFPNVGKPIIEANYYYDVSKTGIGFHGDTERSKVIGLRLGNDFPIHFQWYHRSEPISNPFVFNLSHGDMYMMSEKTVGTDWRSSSKYTLRHAAGFDKFLKK